MLLVIVALGMRCGELNAAWVYDQAARAGVEVAFGEMVPTTLNQERPVLPAPHQVVAELGKIDAWAWRSPRRTALVYHGWVTLSATLVGVCDGHHGWGFCWRWGSCTTGRWIMSVMPWAIASQTIPILAIAPMIIVVLNSVGVTGLIPKAIISAYLSFFPVVVGMVKGLRSPDAMQLDLLRTYSAPARRRRSGSCGCRRRCPICLPA